MTRLYMVNDTAPTGTPTAEQSTTYPNGTGRDASGGVARLLRTTIGTGFTTVTSTHDADQNHDDWLMKIFGYALPVAQDIEAQTWTVSVWSNESNAAANTCVNIALYVYRPGTGVIGYIGDAHHTPTNGEYYEEPGTSFAEQLGTLSGAAVSGVQSGDLLVCEVWHHVTHSMSVAYTSGLRYSGAAADHDSYIETPQDLTTVLVNLVIDGATHAHAVESTDLTQVHGLTIADAAQAQTTGPLVFTQDHSLVLQDSTHAHTAETPTLTEQGVEVDLVIANASHAHEAANAVLVQNSDLEIAAAAHAHTTDPLVFTQVHGLTIAASAHAHVAGEPALPQVHSLVVDPAGHAHSVESVGISTEYMLGIQDSTHAHVADGPDFTQDHQLVVAPASHAHTAANVVLSGAGDPYQVQNLIVSAVSPTQIDLMWDDVEALAGHTYGFQIERNSEILIEQVYTTTYTDDSCAPDTEYTYRVRAFEVV